MYSDRERTEDLVCIVDVVFSEVGGTPAGDGVADVLGGADDRREDDQEQDGVAVVQAVDHVVVVAKMDLDDAGPGADDAVHGSAEPQRSSHAPRRPNVDRPQR